MGDKEDYLTSYRVFFENFAATVNPEDQLPVYAPDYSITEAELPGDVIYWCIEYLREKSCPATLLTPLLRIILDEVRTASKKYPNEFGFDAENSVYRAIWLMQAVIARVNDVCLRYLDNAKLDTLPPPPPPSQKEFRSVSAAMRNSRRVMEDRHVEVSNLEALFGIETTEHTSFYAVYDGHAGSSAAQYSVAHLHQYLVESPHFQKNLRKALHDAFIRTDAEFIRKSKQEHRVIGGSTAVVVCIRGKRMLVAWAGDSLALVAQRMRVMQLVHPHKPSREDERERIESAGGTVMFWGTWRVDGQLAVSRAIGDAQYKPYVTAKPELGALDLDGDEDFLVVACDGLWDVVSEDEVALAVYRQIAADPNDLKAVTKRLIVHAKREGSEDNISIIVVFLKDPRDIAAQNCPPMDLGLDNAVVNAPPFAIEGDVCKVTATVDEAAGGDCATADNGVSDSDSEDLGPETAVDVEADDGDVEMRNHDPAPPTPPAHSVEESHIDGNLVDNVAESGEESEDEWNYYKGEGEPEQNPSEEADDPPRSETPCQDNSAWESSSVDMNSSPLNPDAPVFVPGGVAGSDVLLAESPRKPLPMEDIIVPDVKQFETEAGGRPAELQDLDNCDHLNGHHNISIEGITAHLNGNNKCEMDSFKFNVGIESDKIKDSSLIQDFERIQKDTTDFCNIQVFQAHSETNPFGMDSNDELFERLKNKERDPMSMSFYQEKDDDTCERFSKVESQVDLNSVQPLPDSDDEDIQPNGENQIVMEDDKENISPDHHNDLFSQINNGDEPNNDIMRFDDRTEVNNFGAVENIIDCNVDSNNMQSYSNTEFECNIQQDNVAPTDTPESHKLLFEQIPEIPDGKSSELGFNNDDLLDPSESEKDTRAVTPHDDLSQQDEELENKLEDSKYKDTQPEIPLETKDQIESTFIEHTNITDKDNEIVPESLANIQTSDQLSHMPEPTETTTFDQFLSDNSFVNENNTIVDVHQSEKPVSEFEIEVENSESGLTGKDNGLFDAPIITLESDEVPVHDIVPTKSPGPVENETQSPLPELEQPEEFTDQESLLLKESSLPRDSPLPNDLLTKSPLPSEVVSEGLEFAESPVPSQSPLPTQSPLPSIEALSPIPTEEKPTVPAEVPLPRESPAPSESPFPEERVCQQSPHLVEESIQRESPLKEEFVPVEESVTRNSPFPVEESLSRESPYVEEAVPGESYVPVEESVRESPLLVKESELKDSLPVDDIAMRDSPLPVDEIAQESHLPSDEFITRDSPLIMDKLAPMKTTEDVITKESPLPLEESVSRGSPLPTAQALLANSPHPIENSIPNEASLHVKDESELCESTFPEESPRHSPVEEVQNESLLANVQNESPMPVESQECVEDSTISIPEKELETSAPAQEISLESQYQKSEHMDVLCENAPAPDIVSEHTRSELVTDIDIGIPESRAQEICVPVMNEIQNDAETIRPATTPPPTPAIEPTSEPSLGEVPVATPAVPVAAAVLAGAAVATAAAAAAKPKATPAKKSPTTPTPRPKTAPKAPTPAKTPTSATKRPTSTTTPRTAPTKPAAPKSPISATAKAAKPSPKPASPTKAAPKPLAPVKEAPATAKAAPARTTSAPRPATKPAAPKPPATAKSTTTVTKTSTTTAPRVPATKPAPRPISAKPSVPAKTTTAPATARSGISALTKPKAPERKPLTNGDLKPAAKPAPKPAAPAARPAPRPAPRAPAAAPAKPASAKPPVRAPLDKQSKDLANKRITAKTAPPRTVPAKSSVANKYAMKSVPKRSDAIKKAALPNGVDGDGADARKQPPSPPADSALLPDVIA